MSETVFIVGAGVSKKAGAPLMKDFLDVADKLRKRCKPPDDDFELVFRGKDALQAVYSKATLDLVNVEAVYAAFEMAALLRRLDPLSPEEIQKLPTAMARLIYRTLEDQISFPVIERRVRSPEPYDQIALLTRDHIREHNRTNISFITFNYDLCLDFALAMTGIPPDYCLGEPSHGSVKLLKLHGSLNWVKCPKCGLIVPWDIMQFLQRYNWNLFGGETAVKLNIAMHFSDIKHCDSPFPNEPYIAPPTWNKTQYHLQLESVWQAAARELSEAENIVICGYSLPDTDQFFRYLYALGSVGRSGLKKFWVINPDRSLEQKFRDLCGPLARARFEFFDRPIEEGIGLFPHLLKS
jgi:hypothetical protein